LVCCCILNQYLKNVCRLWDELAAKRTSHKEQVPLPEPLQPSSQVNPPTIERPLKDISSTFTWLDEAVEDAQDLEVLADAFIQHDISSRKEQPLDYEMDVHSTDADSLGMPVWVAGVTDFEMLKPVPSRLRPKRLFHCICL
jgi:hypothetical protein